MIPYIIAFFITNVLAFIGEKEYKKNKMSGIIILIISVLPIILLGGMRITGLGWDTERYCVPIFEGVHKLDLKNAIKFLDTKQAEPGFGILVYVLSMIFDNINFVLTCLMAITTYAVLYYLFKNKDKCSIVFGLLLYEATLYPIAYSTLRQCISIAIIIIACATFLEKKYISTILLIMLSSLFHDSYYMAIATFIIIFVNDSKKLSIKTKRCINVIVLLAIAISVFFYGDILKYLWHVGIVNDKYIRYLGSRFESSGLSIRWPLLLYKSFTIIMCSLYFVSKKIPKDEKECNKKWYIMLLIDYIISLFSFRLVNAHRSTYYIFFPALFVFLPQTFKVFKDDKFNKVLSYMLVSMVYIIYFITSLKYYSIFPYRGILKIG